MNGPDYLNYGIPFKLYKYEKAYLHNLQKAYQKQIKALLFTPLNHRSTIITILYLLKQLQNKTEATQFCYLVETKKRKNFVLQLAEQLYRKYFNNQEEWLPLNLTKITSNLKEMFQKKKLLIVTTFEQYTQKQFYEDNTNTVSFGLIETTNITNTINSSIQSYITDTYIRRAYIEASKLLQGYKLHQKCKKSANQGNNKIDFVPLISLVSKDSQFISESQQNNSEKKGIFETYQQKKQQMTGNTKNTFTQRPKFEKNQLILISLMIYLIGYLQTAIQPRKSKYLHQFFDEFKNKTLLSSSIFENMPKYLKRIVKNCPFQLPYQLQQMYLYHIFEFFKKLYAMHAIYPNLQNKAVIIKFQKMSLQKNDFIFQQSLYSMRIFVIQPKQIMQILMSRINNFVFVQNLTVPQSYINQLYENQLVITKPLYSTKNLYGVHISKTPSNQDIQFTKATKNINMNIKMKACGVLLYELSQFVPDGMIVYFYSTQGLNSFLKILNQQEQKILSKLDTTKKIFIESQFQSENIKNISVFEKCCNIGKGAIYFLSAHSNLAKYHQFYQHYSRCVVFIGLPKQNFEDDIVKRPQTQIPTLHRCLNNCLNQTQIPKSILFVGRQINTGLDKWVQFVHKWDQTAREPLATLREFYKTSQQLKLKSKLV